MLPAGHDEMPVRADGVISREMDGEFVVLNTVTDEAHRLTGDAAEAWRTLTAGEPTSLSSGDVEAFRAEFTEKGLFLPLTEAPSRRSLLRSGVVAGAAVAVVGIETVVLPANAWAASSNQLPIGPNAGPGTYDFNVPYYIKRLNFTLRAGAGAGGATDGASGSGGSGGNGTALEGSIGLPTRTSGWATWRVIVAEGGATPETGSQCLSVTNKQRNNSTSTLTTATPHGFSVGQQVTIALTTADARFDGIRTITSVNANTNTFSFTSSSGSNTNVATTGTVTAASSSRIRGGNLVVQNYARTGAQATLTVGAHNFKVGDRVTVAGINTTFNGTFVLTAATAPTLSYTTPTSGTVALTTPPNGATVIGGAVGAGGSGFGAGGPGGGGGGGSSAIIAPVNGSPAVVLVVAAGGGGGGNADGTQSGGAGGGGGTGTPPISPSVAYGTANTGNSGTTATGVRGTGGATNAGGTGTAGAGGSGGIQTGANGNPGTVTAALVGGAGGSAAGPGGTGNANGGGGGAGWAGGGAGEQGDASTASGAGGGGAGGSSYFLSPSNGYSVTVTNATRTTSGALLAPVGGTAGSNGANGSASVSGSTTP